MSQVLLLVSPKACALDNFTPGRCPTTKMVVARVTDKDTVAPAWRAMDCATARVTVDKAPEKQTTCPTNDGGSGSLRLLLLLLLSLPPKLAVDAAVVVIVVVLGGTAPGG